MIYNSEHPLKNIKKDKNLLFLAGSIDLNSTETWRETVISKLDDHFNLFDPTAQNYEALGEEDWNEHIKWELLAMEMSDMILINFLADAKSPISLVELGLNTGVKKLVVVCPDGFYKKQYINALCKHYSIPIFKDLNQATAFIRSNFS